MAFTTPTATNWRSAAFVNEIRAGIRERQTALGQSLLALAAAGDSAQSASGNFAAMQAAMEALATGFCNHQTSAGDYSGLSAVPMWTLADLFEAMASGQTGWRRQVVKGTYATPGQAQEGDLIGAWLFEDLQRALALLLWIPVTGLFQSLGDANTKNPGASTDSSAAAAKSAAEAAYAAFTPGTSFPYEAAQAYAYQEQHGVSFIAELLRSYFYFGNGTGGNMNLPTLAAAADLDLYFAAAAHSGGLNGNVFDANGDGLVESDPATIGAKQKTVAYDGGGTCWTQIGSLDQPAWCTDPASNGESYTRGYKASGGVLVVHAGDAFTWK